MTTKIIHSFELGKEIDVVGFDKISYQAPTLTKSVKTMKPPIVSAAMIKKLQSKGCYFSEEDLVDAQKFLKEVNYYTFRTYYNYVGIKEYTALKSVYQFEKALRNIIQNITVSIELLVKTTLIDTICEFYKSEEYQIAEFYLDNTIYQSKAKKQRIKEQFKIEISKVLNDKQNKAVIHNIEKYGGVPAWVLFSSFSFGPVTTFVNILNNDYRKIWVARLNNSSDDLSLEFPPSSTKADILPDALVPAWINSLRYLRNLVSHSGKIYGLQLDIPCKIHEEDQIYILSERNGYLFEYLLVAKRFYLCCTDSSISEWNRSIEQIKEALLEYDKEMKYVQLDLIGFPDNWEDILSIK